jgi:hypothetical protein
LSRLRAAATPMAEADPCLPEARFEAATCDACGSAAQTKLYQFDFESEASGIVRCGGCGLAYSSPRPTPNALGAFYGDGYYSFGPPKLPDPGAALSFKERLRRKILARHMGYTKISSADAGVPALFTRFLARFLVMPDWRAARCRLRIGRADARVAELWLDGSWPRVFRKCGGGGALGRA